MKDKSPQGIVAGTVSLRMGQAFKICFVVKVNTPSGKISEESIEILEDLSEKQAERAQNRQWDGEEVKREGTYSQLCGAVGIFSLRKQQDPHFVKDLSAVDW